MKTNKRIEIVSSSIKALSSMSARSRNAIATVLARHYTDVHITIINNLSDLEALVARKPDLVFLGMKSLRIRSSSHKHCPQIIWVADYLAAHGIAHTGSAGTAHRLEADKSLAKQQVRSAGLATAQSIVARQGVPLRETDIPLAYPVFVKPTSCGGGDGVDEKSVAYTFSKLRTKVISISDRLHADSLVESYLPGREFSVALLRTEPDGAYWVMPVELVAEPNEQGARILGGGTKSANAEIVLPVPDGATRTAVCSLAINAFSALQAQDYGRIDIRMDACGVPHFLEANLIPSLIAGYGSFPKASMINRHIEYEDMILHITRLGLAHSLNDCIQTWHPAVRATPSLSAPENDLAPAFAA